MCLQQEKGIDPISWSEHHARSDMLALNEPQLVRETPQVLWFIVKLDHMQSKRLGLVIVFDPELFWERRVQAHSRCWGWDLIYHSKANDTPYRFFLLVMRIIRNDRHTLLSFLFSATEFVSFVHLARFCPNQQIWLLGISIFLQALLLLFGLSKLFPTKVRALLGIWEAPTLVLNLILGVFLAMLHHNLLHDGALQY
jgi:hypothetical protein